MPLFLRNNLEFIYCYYYSLKNIHYLVDTNRILKLCNYYKHLSINKCSLVIIVINYNNY